MTTKSFVPEPQSGGKRLAVLEHLRGQITSGRLAPGSRLPTRDELVVRLGVSRATVQNAMDRLIEHGFVCTRGGQGTFVADRPPSLSNFALVFPALPTGHWSRFYQVLMQEAQSLVRSQHRTLQIYCTDAGKQSHPEFQRLRQDVEDRKLAGIVFGQSPFEYLESGLLARIHELGIRGASVTYGRVRGFPGVAPDLVSFRRLAMERFGALRRKRLGIIATNAPNEPIQELHELAKSHGMETQRYWTHQVDPFLPQPAQNVVELMMRLPKDCRPDALLVRDDHLLESVIAGLVAARVNVPEEVAVISQWNFPAPLRPALPVERIGFDARQIIEQCLTIIDAQIAGKAVPDVTLVSAIHEDELHLR